MPHSDTEHRANTYGGRLWRIVEEALEQIESYQQDELQRAVPPDSPKIVGWQARILAVLFDDQPESGLELKRIVKLLGVKTQTASVTLSKLKNIKLVTRSGQLWKLTPEGSSLASQISAIQQAALTFGTAAFKGDSKLIKDLGIATNAWSANFKVLTCHATSNRPSPAGIYDSLIGGSFNHVIDREAAEAILDQLPVAREAACANRQFLRRAVYHLAKNCKVRQFIDTGAGYPSTNCTHEIVNEVADDARVYYVDSDPDVVETGKAALKGYDNAKYYHGEVSSISELIHRGDFEKLDPSKPTAIIMVAVLHFIPDDAAVHAALDGLRKQLPHSYLVISHGCRDESLMTQDILSRSETVRELYEDKTKRVTKMRTMAEIEALFRGWAIIKPGLKFAPEWKTLDQDPPHWEDYSYSFKSSAESLVVAGIGETKKS